MNEAQLRSIVDLIPFPVLRKDLEGHFTFANGLFCEVVGKPLSEIIGKTDLDLYPSELAQKYREDDAQVIASGNMLKRVQQDRSACEVRYVEVMKSPVRDSRGRVVGIQVVFWDVTGQKEAEEALRTSEMRFRTIHDSSRDAIMTLTPETGFLSGNPAAVKLFGCTDEAHFTSLTPADLSPEFQPDGVASSAKAQQMMRMAMEEGSHFFEWTHRRADGSIFDASVLLTRMELEGRPMLQATVRDITDQKKVAAALQKAKEAAEAASVAKSEFLARMSHEVRTPMHAIINMTELVLDTELSKSQEENLKLVCDSADSLLTVINDILDFSKIEAGKLDLDERAFDLREALGDTMKSLSDRAHKKGLELACDVPANVPDPLVGDPARLRQIVVNLVGNAIKFTEAGEVVLGVECEEETDELVTLHFTVTDTGIGISPGKGAVIFDAFEQADSSRTRKYDGTGLGLTISARLVEMMHGKLWVESQEGQGSTFHFTIRCRLGVPSERRDLAEKLSLLEGTRVLVVDDNATSRRILDEVLRSWTLRPQLANSVVKAFELIEHAHRAGQPFDLVLTDVHMPNEDGFALVEQIRRQELSSTVIMMLTSGDQEDVVARCERLDVAGYVLKPIKQSELFDSIMQAMCADAVDVDATPALAESDFPQIRPLDVLLAEDNLVNQRVAVALLQKHGHTVTVANNGREAVDQLNLRSFDLVLMDVQMPVMDGFDACRTIRAQEEDSGGHTPIIAMTAHALKGDRERCLKAGMDDYVSKPVHARQLFDVIASQISRRPCEGNDSKGTAPVDKQRAASGTVDWNAVLDRLDGDAELLRSLIGLAVTEIPKEVAPIRDATTMLDRNALRKAAHKLKGSLRYFGESTAEACASTLEETADEISFEVAARELDRLECEVRALLRAMTEYLNNTETG
ncbi:MAG: response regulator [Pirellulaceae bacterium]